MPPASCPSLPHSSACLPCCCTSRHRRWRKRRQRPRRRGAPSSCTSCPACDGLWCCRRACCGGATPRRAPDPGPWLQGMSGMAPCTRCARPWEFSDGGGPGNQSTSHAGIAQNAQRKHRPCVSLSCWVGSGARARAAQLKPQCRRVSAGFGCAGHTLVPAGCRWPGWAPGAPAPPQPSSSNRRQVECGARIRLPDREPGSASRAPRVSRISSLQCRPCQVHFIPGHPGRAPQADHGEWGHAPGPPVRPPAPFQTGPRFPGGCGRNDSGTLPRTCGRVLHH